MTIFAEISLSTSNSGTWVHSDTFSINALGSWEASDDRAWVNRNNVSDTESVSAGESNRASYSGAWISANWNTGSSNASVTRHASHGSACPIDVCLDIDALTILADLVESAFDEIARTGSTSDSNDVGVLAGLAFVGVADVLAVSGIGAEGGVVEGWEEVSALTEPWIGA